MKQKIEAIQILRGIAALSVVIFHIWGAELRFGNVHHILPLFFYAGIYGVDLFFVISGFIMVTVTQGQFQSIQSITRFLYNRAARIYPVYWFYSLIALAVFLTHPGMVNVSQGNRVDLLRSFLLFPQNTKPLLAVGWTLIHEVHFYLVFTLLLLFPEKHLIKLLLLWGFLVVFGNLTLHPSSALSPLIILATNPLSLEFICGCLIAKAYFSGVRRFGLMSVIVGISLLVLASIFHAYVSPINNEVPGWSREFLFGLPCALIVYGTVSTLMLRLETTFSRILLALGDASYSLYLSHALVVSGLGNIWVLLFLNAKLSNVYFIIFMFFGSISAGILSYRFIESPLLKITRRLYKYLASLVYNKSDLA
jgi:exopolysaccharide production protein ExoZ